MVGFQYGTTKFRKKAEVQKVSKGIMRLISANIIPRYSIKSSENFSANIHSYEFIRFTLSHLSKLPILLH